MMRNPDALPQCEIGKTAPEQELLGLPESQAGPGRHKCCHCAFQQGLEDAQSGWWPAASDIYRCEHGKAARLSAINRIHENQGGIQRHKCPICAYAKGFMFDQESLFILGESKSDNGELILVEPPDFAEEQYDVVSNASHGNYWVNLTSNRAREIGMAGEETVVEFEKKKLREANKHALAEKIIHVSKDWGDGAGYDVLSYEPNGAEILIEVKTTLREKDSGFFITANEMKCARENRENYRIDRIFEFNPNSRSGGIFYLSVEQLEKMHLIPLQYKCEFQLII